MNKRDMIKIVNSFCEEIVNELSFELVDVDYVKEFGSNFLRVYIDKPNGVSLDDCQKMSELLSKKLDEKDPIKDAYYLEVSSPGLDRPLKTDKDLQRNLGKEVEVKLYKAIENKKKFEGILRDFNEDEVIITIDSSHNMIISKEYISLMRLKINF